MDSNQEPSLNHLSLPEALILESSFIEVDKDHKVLQDVILGISQTKFLIAGFERSRITKRLRLELRQSVPLSSVDISVHSYLRHSLRVAFESGQLRYFMLGEMPGEDTWAIWQLWADSLKLISQDLDTRDESTCTADSYISQLLNSSALQPEPTVPPSPYQLTCLQDRSWILSSSLSDMPHYDLISPSTTTLSHNFTAYDQTSKSSSFYYTKSSSIATKDLLPSGIVDPDRPPSISFSHYLFKESKPLIKPQSSFRSRSLLGSEENKYIRAHHALLKFSLPQLPSNFVVPLNWEQLRKAADDVLKSYEASATTPRNHHHRMAIVYIMPFSNLHIAYPLISLKDPMFRIFQLKRASSELNHPQHCEEFLLTEERALLRRTSSLPYLSSSSYSATNSSHSATYNLQEFWIYTPNGGMFFTSPCYTGFQLLKRIGLRWKFKNMLAKEFNSITDFYCINEECTKPRQYYFTKNPEDVRLETYFDPVPRMFARIKNNLDINFLDFHEGPLAASLISLQKELFLRLTPEEMVHMLCKGTQSSPSLPNVEACLHFYLRIFNLTVSEILKPRSKEERVLVLAKFITLARNSLMLYNWESCMAILSGLQSTPIMLLEETWDHLRLKRHDRYRTFINLCEEVRDAERRRQRLHKCLLNDWPVIPHLEDLLDLCSMKLRQLESMESASDRKTDKWETSGIPSFTQRPNLQAAAPLTQEQRDLLGLHHEPLLLLPRQCLAIVSFILLQFKKLAQQFPIDCNMPADCAILGFFLRSPYSSSRHSYVLSRIYERWTWKKPPL